MLHYCEDLRDDIRAVLKVKKNTILYVKWSLMQAVILFLCIGHNNVEGF